MRVRALLVTTLDGSWAIWLRQGGDVTGTALPAEAVGGLEACLCFEPSRADRLGESGVVVFVLVCVGLGEVGDGAVEDIALAEV